MRPFTLHPFQKEALTILERPPSHVLCVAPTGSGKSLIYERTIARNLQRGAFRTILVTPLISLGRQQRERLRSISPLLGYNDGHGERDAWHNRTGTWIVSPESVTSERGRQLLLTWKPDFFVVDECHCIWEWGERFRPAFAALPSLARVCGAARSLWLTATLPPEAREALRQQLPTPLTELGEFALPPGLSLSIWKVPLQERLEALLEWLHPRAGTGLIFVPTRDWTTRLARALSLRPRDGRRIFVYHAGLGKEERENVEAVLRRQEPCIVVATSAFGMGMDFAQLAWVALWQPPPSLLALAQAIGRASRGGGHGDALLLWHEDDFRTLEWLVRGSERQHLQLLRIFEYLRAYECRLTGLRQYFQPGEKSAKHDEMPRAQPKSHC